MTSAVIFLDDAKKLAGEAICFGCRFDTQYLPKNSIVVGFMVVKGSQIVELLDEPFITEEQRSSWDATLAYARAVLDQNWSEYQKLEEGPIL